ncbi:MAG: hypothetical protein CO186_11775 [Zetaproteobacteria bacterium CG_4_9_14_3_um_filter_49_83]|nr:MAG: hypothetical protein AUJ56_10190 [Zetaproteobacteria bacterium CG1_02_49_23]PIQ34398.1 MAG: hypothetical protein COW62_01645 [Zetaproteobacteria bacterium CG17_big_fil_post_rev_8_21_14_2_50_50_13]PIV30286.1 MAG: hypothetical protein COS35_07560 [Zetaproteobacteria bacterium CG02_land_8_20_14_3_00_50_9]PIY56382.1 MAG: hypothetical protein COZ00_04135 [Zetaproteobacteria bacterium CG_4_10_14_0_8_um_filter_49_80]PJA34022.1 MAG: hypothetical protein CO186_11775 [Zetaproteobacteria bacterium
MFHVVDDNLISGKNTAKIINLFNEKSRHFSSAMDYIEYLTSSDYERPTAIFTDLMMFKLGGYEMIEAILESYPDQRFVVISGRPDIDHPFKNRACFYLKKPYYPRDIEKIILKLKSCEQQGTLPDTDCAFECDCSAYGLKDWKCPHT